MPNSSPSLPTGFQLACPVLPATAGALACPVLSPQLLGPAGSASQLSALDSSLQSSPSALAHPGLAAVSFQGYGSIQRTLTQLSTSHPPDRSRWVNSGVDAGSCLAHHRSSAVLSTLPQQESQRSSPAFPIPLGLLLLGTPGRS